MAVVETIKFYCVLVFCLNISIIILLFLENVNSHGRLIEPPGRSTLWRFKEYDEYDPPINYDDNELYCGGFGILYDKNGGKCGVCGDRYDQPKPRDHEGGGVYARGIIARNYSSGQIIKISIDMKKSHWGYFEFHLCPQNNPTVSEQDSCFDKYTLQFADGSGTKYKVNTDAVQLFYNTTVILPKGLTCSQCVLRWHYRTGNTWGICENGTGADGCGDQEIFRGCADIAIH